MEHLLHLSYKWSTVHTTLGLYFGNYMLKNHMVLKILCTVGYFVTESLGTLRDRFRW